MGLKPFRSSSRVSRSRSCITIRKPFIVEMTIRSPESGLSRIRIRPDELKILRR